MMDDATPDRVGNEGRAAFHAMPMNVVVEWLGADPERGLSTAEAEAWAYHSGSPNWQTVAFTVLTLAQLAHALAIRSERDSLFVIGLSSNRPLLGALALALLLQLAVVYAPRRLPGFDPDQE